MHIEDLQQICKQLPHVTEDVKWGHDLCFCVGEKMFLVIGLDSQPVPASFKVPDEDFPDLSSREGFKPAPYLARYKWVHVSDINLLGKTEWERYAKQSYDLIRSKLPKKILRKLG